MHADPDSERVLDLLVEWEELRRQGKTATAEELCPDDAQLQATLRDRLARRQRLNAVLDLPTETRSAPATETASLPVIDGYEMGELLGRGGMGLVFKARQQALKRYVALKIILSGAHAGADERGRFRTEALAVARLHHPGIVQIYEVGEQAGCPYLVLELVSGGSLAAQLQGTPMPPRRAAQLLLDLARALQHAHEQGIVHRDLKPANVLLTETGGAKIADFGLAKLLDVEQGQTHTGAVLGSPSYMAPEQAAGKGRAIGPATDLYALGAILYEMLTGRPPFLGASFLETLEQVRSHELAPPQTLQPTVPADLATICLKCLEKVPAERYPSAAALAHDLELFLRGEAIMARTRTFWDQATRLLRHSQTDVNWGTRATLMFCLAPVPFLLQVALYAFYRDRPAYPLAAIGVSVGTIAVLLFAIFFRKRASLRAIEPGQRRQYLSTWLSHFIGLVLVTLTVLRMSHPSAPEEWFVIYALWLILTGCTFFSFAANEGILYLSGVLCFLLAALAPLIPFAMPLIVGGLMSLNVTTLGLLLRRLARQAAAE
jgi:tRNA A-37 threonylcarbamoyl transferase component Bud32